MSDLTSLRAILRLELHQNSAMVDVAIADSIKHVRAEKFWFNGAAHSFTTSLDQNRYELPRDFLGLRGKVRVTPSNSTTTGRYYLHASTADEVEDLLFDGVDFASYENRGYAKRYGIDLMGKAILIAPKPDPGGDLVEFKYTRDLGTPTYTISTTLSAPPSLSPTVTLLGPNGETLQSTFTNEWFKEGFKLVKERALYELWSRFHSGTEEAAIGAQGALTRYLEELVRLRGETAQISSVTKVRKHL